ncbi:unnamed protein product, partial [marine sediment metagenome]
MLSPKDVERIHNASLETLEKTGIEVNNRMAFQIFKEKGARVDSSKRRVKIPRAMVNDAIDKAPSKVVLYGREEKYNLILENKRVYMRSEFFFPKVSDRSRREKWLAEGGKDARQRAREMAINILATHKPLAIPCDIQHKT